jgi:hypothetical protein
MSGSLIRSTGLDVTAPANEFFASCAASSTQTGTNPGGGDLAILGSPSP